MANANFTFFNDIDKQHNEVTYTAALRINTAEGVECVRLKSGLSHTEASDHAEVTANSEDYKHCDVLELSVIRD